MAATSTMDEAVERFGHGYGGCAIIRNHNIKGKMIKVDINNNCLCGIQFILNGMLFFIFIGLCAAVLSIFMRKNSSQITHAIHMTMTTSGQI